jgi:hypothetical protein
LFFVVRLETEASHDRRPPTDVPAVLAGFDAESKQVDVSDELAETLTAGRGRGRTIPVTSPGSCVRGPSDSRCRKSSGVAA